jgi:molybdate transport system substrate-binding protein
MFSRSFVRMAAALVLAWLLVLPGQVRAEGVLVFAAASLKTALDEIAEDWRAQTGKDVTISYAGSSSLARQIEQGLPPTSSSPRRWTGWTIFRPQR